MTSIARRLTIVERAVARMPPRATPADLSRLTDAERVALAEMDARYGPLPRRPDGRVDPSMVSDADIDIVASIAERLRGRGAA